MTTTQPPRTVEEFEDGHFAIDALSPEHRRFLLRAIDALRAAAGMTDDDYDIEEHLVDQLRWAKADDVFIYCVDERWVMDQGTGAQVDPTPAATTTCRHCHRPLVEVNGGWVDPEATGDDVVWRETCDAHDTFQAEHEPEEGG